MKKIILIFIPFLFSSCANFLNEKFKSTDNLATCFKSKVNGIEVIYTAPECDNLKIAASDSDSEVTLTAIADFTTYLWTVDGEVQSENSNKISISKNLLDGGYHLVTVIVTDDKGIYFSASIYIKVNNDKKFTETEITTGFEGTNTKILELTSTTENDIATISATSGFYSYSWLLDGNSVLETSRVFTINTSSLQLGSHLVSLIAKDSDGIFYSANVHIKKTETLELDIKCSGISIIFPSADSTSFSVSSVSSEKTVLLNASDGFSSYEWTIDGNSLSGSDNELSVDLSSLTAGFHLITVTAKNTDGVSYSSSIQIKKTQTVENASVKNGNISINFESDNKAFTVTKTISENNIQLTATSDFTDYIWNLDGTVIESSENTATVDSSTLETGFHLITVTAKSGNLYYSASINIEKTE